MPGHFRTIIVLAQLVLCPSMALADWGEAQREKATELARRFVEPQHDGHAQAPGLSLAVSRNGKLLMADGFGQALPTIPARAETIYPIGSLTKQFTAAALLREIDRRRQLKSGATLGFETPVAEVIPAAAAWSLETGPVMTIRHLLTMTSNLPNFTRQPPETVDPWGAIHAPRLLDALTQVKPTGEPGAFEYSNTSYFLLAELLESPRLDGQKTNYRETLRALWAGAGLHDTGFQDDAAVGKVVAGPTYKRRPAFLYGDWLKGSADATSTVLDLQTWNKELIEGRVLSQPMLEQMFSESARVDVWTWYGMGWFLREKDGLTYLLHSGSLPGYTAFNLIIRKADGNWASACVLTNSYGVEGLEELAETLARTALDD